MKGRKPFRVDFHTHIIPDTLPEMEKIYGGDRWPELQKTCSCGANIVVQGKIFRKIEKNCWDPAKRLEDMEKEGIDLQVLSPIPVTFSYWATAEAGLAMSQYQNEFISSVVSRYPQKFVGLGTVPLQDVGMAIQEMGRIKHQLGLHGVEIGSNVNGMNLDDESLIPFFEAASEWNVPIFIHPWATIGKERLTRYNAMYTVGMPSETALSASSLIMGGILDKFPRLKICFAHGGGSLPYILPRLDKGWQSWEHIRQTEYPPSHYAKMLYFDSLVYDSSNLQFMVDRFGTEKIIAGSDYPFPIREIPAGKVIEGMQLPVEQASKMLGENALTFLNVVM